MPTTAPILDSRARAELTLDRWRARVAAAEDREAQAALVRAAKEALEGGRLDAASLLLLRVEVRARLAVFWARCAAGLERELAREVARAR